MVSSKQCCYRNVVYAPSTGINPPPENRLNTHPPNIVLLEYQNSRAGHCAKGYLSKSAVGKTIGYSLRQWPKLIRHIDHGDLNIDNNRAERAIKPFVIGRKNWTFANIANGANSNATLYSLIETAKANGLNSFDYIKHLLDELLRNPASIDHLLPWNVDLTSSEKHYYVSFVRRSLYW